MKGLSALKICIPEGPIDLSPIAIPVAAAASVPSSFTSMKALCTAFCIYRLLSPVMPEKSALYVNAVGIPSEDITGPSEYDDEKVNLGKKTFVFCRDIMARKVSILSAERPFSTSAKEAGFLGSITSISSPILLAPRYGRRRYWACRSSP